MSLGEGRRAICGFFIFWTFFSGQASIGQVPSGKIIYPDHVRLTGVLRHESLKRDQLAKLDLITSDNPNGTKSVLALLTLQLGDYSSDEYISYHFDEMMIRELPNGKLSAALDQTNQEVGVTIPDFSFDGFSGELRPNFSEEIALLILRKDGEVPLKYPLIESIWGEYASDCTGNRQFLQLYSSRSVEDTTKVGHSFADYEIHGSLLDTDPDFCYGLPCVKNSIFGGSYNFYTNHLDLDGKQGSIDCDTRPEGLLCDKCLFTRVSKETVPPRVLKPRMAPPVFTASERSDVSEFHPARETLSGVYKGYLHHEYLNEFQSASIDIDIIPQTSGGDNFQILPLAKLYFGDHSSPERLAYRYDPIAVTARTNRIVFRKPGTGVDAIVEITSIKGGVLKGIWYSLLFGRVGTFEVHKTGMPALPKEAKIFDMLRGKYETDKSEIDISVSATHVPLTTENPFFPLNFMGHVIFVKTKLFAARYRIKGGSFDFYTGRIAFFTLKDTVIVGERTSATTLSLRPMPTGFMHLGGSHKLREYHRAPNGHSIQKSSAKAQGGLPDFFAQ